MDLETRLRYADLWKALKRDKNKLPSKKAWRLLKRWYWFNTNKLYEYIDHLKTGKTFRQSFEAMGMGGKI